MPLNAAEIMGNSRATARRLAALDVKVDFSVHLCAGTTMMTPSTLAHHTRRSGTNRYCLMFPLLPAWCLCLLVLAPIYLIAETICWITRELQIKKLDSKNAKVKAQQSHRSEIFPAFHAARVAQHLEIWRKLWWGVIGLGYYMVWRWRVSVP